MSDAGKCQLWDESVEMNGCSNDGYCNCEDDPNPWDSCESFEPFDPTEYEEDEE